MNEEKMKKMIEAYKELTPEIGRELALNNSGTPVRQMPPFESVAKDFLPLPPEAMFWGISSADGNPVLLNLYDPRPGCFLVVGDSGSGKTHILQSFSKFINMVHDKENVQFGVMTRYPEEWGNLDNENSVGIFPTYLTNSEDFLLSLASWAHARKDLKQSFVLFFDGLENIMDMNFDAMQNFRWLMLRGAAKRVWVIATINSGMISETISWVEGFRNHIFGKISNETIINNLGIASARTQSLDAGNEFCIRENDGWLKFWIPS